MRTQKKTRDRIGRAKTFQSAEKKKWAGGCVDPFQSRRRCVFFPMGSFFLRFPCAGNFARQRQAKPPGTTVPAHTVLPTTCFANVQPSSGCAAEAWWDIFFQRSFQAGEAASGSHKTWQATPQSSRAAASAPKLSPPPSKPRWGAAYATAKMLRRQPSLLEWASFDAHRSLAACPTTS